MEHIGLLQTPNLKRCANKGGRNHKASPIQERHPTLNNREVGAASAEQESQPQRGQVLTVNTLLINKTFTHRLS